MSTWLRSEIPPTAGLPTLFSDFLRPAQKSLQQELIEHFSLPEPILTCSGTAAFVTILRVLKKHLPKRTEVILPAYTCPLMPLAVHLCGLHTVICDTQINGNGFDLNQLENLCSEKTLAVVPTHLAGHPVDLLEIQNITSPLDIFIIEDAAQSLGAGINGHSVGLQGDAGFFSMAIGKGLTTYEGGILVSKNDTFRRELKEEVKNTLPTNWLWTLRRNVELFGSWIFYRPSLLYFVYGKTLAKYLAEGNPEEAVGDIFDLNIPLHSLDSFRRNVAANSLKRLVSYLDEGKFRAVTRIASLEKLGLSVLKDIPNANGVYPMLLVQLPSKEKRDNILNKLWTSGLGVSRLFIHALPDYNYLSPYIDSSSVYPKAKYYADTMLTISQSHWLTDHLFQKITDTLQLYL